MAKQSVLIDQVNSLKNIISKEGNSHVWQFSRIGGINRVNISSGKDIANLRNLDLKLWTALSCPVSGLEIDPVTLQLIDSDNDGRIRVPEVISATEWITSVIKNPDDLLNDNKTLPLSAINDQTEEGRVLLASAKQILLNLGKEDKSEISVSETSDTAKIFGNTIINGDGIIIEDSTQNEDLKKLISDIISCIGHITDRSGKPGINSEITDKFFAACEQYSNWHRTAEADEKSITPFGNSTKEAFEAFSAVKVKIDDYFVRCRLAEYDAGSAATLNELNERYREIAARELSEEMNEIASFPLAKVNPKMVLMLKEGINPSWKNAIEKFTRSVVVHTLNKEDYITADEWDKLSHIFDAYSNWIKGSKGTEVEKIGLQHVRKILNSGLKKELEDLIEKDIAVKTEAENILKVDILTRYYCDLHTLLKNFVNFSDFYSPYKLAIFQAGRLFIDQRCCDLCINVTDMPKHNGMAGNSGICLLYCDCTHRSKGKKMTIVAALTDGDIDNITVGRNAIFYDRQGGDWDATITKIIENPISIKQAFWSPYKKMSKFFSKQIEKLAASKEAEVETAITKNIENTTSKVDTHLTESVKSKQPEAAVPSKQDVTPQPFDIAKFAGIFAALSLAIGAIGSVLISALAGFFELKWWQMPLALFGMILCISGPSMVLAYLKLRKRDLAPVLDANGWAINARLTINIIFGRTLTHLAKLPENSKVNLTDPFTKKKKPLIPIIIISVIVIAVALYALWFYGYLDKWGIWKFRI